MQIIDKQKFFEIQESFEWVPYPQTTEWAEHCGIHNAVYFTDDVENPKICCFGTENHGKFAKRQLTIHGESVKPELTADQLTEFYAAIRERYDMIHITSLGYYDVNYEIALRKAGFLRPLLSNLGVLTIVVDLNNLAQHRNWRRNSKKAAETLTFRYIDKPDRQDCNRFVEMFDELSKTKGLGYSIDTDGIEKLTASGRFKMFFVENSDGVPVSGRIVYVRGTTAYDTYAANSDESRRTDASYFLMDKVFEWLAANGCTRFDFARIAPGIGGANSVYNFKRLSGGQPVIYNGEWTYCKSRTVETIYFVNNYLRLKMNRY